MTAKFDLDFVVAEFKAIHGDAFNYDKMEYKNSRTVLKIFCNAHKGYIYQRYDKHKSIKECQECVRLKQVEQLFERCTEIHGGKYTYTNSVYIDYITKMTVICPLHGGFHVSPKKHVIGVGCPKCSSIRNLNSQELVEVFLKIHNGKYLYKQDIKIDVKGKVEIICPEHGVFICNAYKHTKGQGCAKCAKEKLWLNNSLDAELFFKNCARVHENKYDYSNAEYQNYQSILNIKCPDHGYFESKAANHIRGSGCGKCASIKRSVSRVKKGYQWIEDFKKVHGDFYIYDKSVFKNSDTPIEIICPLHRAFWLSPVSHMKGFGCLLCLGRRVSLKDYIDRARKVHGLKYDYSETEIKKIDSHISIICRVHGKIKIHANSHLNGHGCKACSIEKKRKSLEKLISEFVSVQGYYYNYDFVIYKDSKSLLKIQCPKHGMFTQRARTHRLGGQCPKCRSRSSVGDCF